MRILSLHGGHSSYGDGAGRLEEFARAALDRDMVVFGFSEHMPRPEKYWYPGERPERNSFQNFRNYLEEARAVQAQFRGKMEILVGAELELIPGLENFLNDFSHQFELDYAVGSVHFVKELGFDYSSDSYHQAVEGSGSIEQFCLDYLDTMASVIGYARFQVLGHFDLFKVFRPQPVPFTESILEKIERLMEQIAACNLLLDINARGLIKPCRDIYPTAEILRIARKNDVAVTLGDDSHAPKEVGKNLDLAVERAREAGYSQISFLHADGSRDWIEC